MQRPDVSQPDDQNVSGHVWFLPTEHGSGLCGQNRELLVDHWSLRSAEIPRHDEARLRADMQKHLRGN